MTTIKDFINNQVEPLQSNDSIIDVQNMFLDFEYTHFPIMEREVFIGSIGRDEAEMYATSDSINEHKYGLHRFFVRNNMNWFDVFEEFSKNNTNILPILDEKNQYIGFYELDDVLHFLNETIFYALSKNSCCFVVVVNYFFCLAEIVACKVCPKWSRLNDCDFNS